MHCTFVTVVCWEGCWWHCSTWCLRRPWSSWGTPWHHNLPTQNSPLPGTCSVNHLYLTQLVSASYNVSDHRMSLVRLSCGHVGSNKNLLSITVYDSVRRISWNQLMSTMYLPFIFSGDNSSVEAQHLACSVYQVALQELPAAIRQWCKSQDKKMASLVDRWISQHLF